MQTRKQNDEVIYTEDQIVQVRSSDIQWLKTQAESNLRKRIRLCTHNNTEDLLHEMFIVHSRNTYVRPHKHVCRTESFHVIEGLVDVVLFDENGMISEVIRMGEYSSGRAFYYRISNPFYHTLLILSDVLVFHETTTGPFNPMDTEFPSWAPQVEDRDLCKAFMSNLSNKVRDLNCCQINSGRRT